MKQDICVFVISLKNSTRFPLLQKRLGKLKIKFKVIEGINGLEYYKKKKINKISNSKKILNNVGRNMSPQEIGAAASHLKIYSYIVKNNIQQAIILEDDAYPSKKMFDWIKHKIEIDNNQILGFYAYPSGIIIKKAKKKVLKNINIHESKTHLFNNSCYQINNFTAKKILKITGGRVIGFADWPFNMTKDKIKFLITIPFMTLINDRGISYLKKSRYEILGKTKFLTIKNMIRGSFLKFTIFLYYILFIPFIFKKYKNLDYYIEHFFLKNFYAFINIFSNTYYEQTKLFHDQKFYCKDLAKEQVKQDIRFHEI